MAPLSLVTLALCLMTSAYGFHVEQFPGATTGPGFLRIPISPQKRDVSLRKRDVSNIDIANFKTAGYTINITIGTPGQQLVVAVDTGSSELWVDPDCAKGSRAANKTVDGHIVTTVDDPLSDPESCRLRGRYDSSKSSSAKNPGINDTVFQYGDMTTAQISYVQDKISIGGLSIDGQIFGVAKESNGTGIGIMGFGPSFFFNNSGTYPLILTSMAKQGVIKSPAFSLHLSDYDNSTGSVIFGGVDKKKYTGSLAKIPFQTVEMKAGNGQTYQSTSYYVTVKSMGLSTPGSSTKSYDIGGTFVASLDCGSSNNLLPAGLAAKVCADVNGTMGSGSTACIVDCSVRQKPGGVTFGLDGKDILVSFENLINEEVFPGQGSTCVVMIQDNTLFLDPPTYILGAPFLRASYAVFDWGNGNLHIAQSADCGTDIVAIGNGTDAVPSGNGECSLGANVVVDFGLMAGAALLSGLALFS